MRRPHSSLLGRGRCQITSSLVQLSTGRAESIPALAESEGVTSNDISRVLQLVFLKPSIIESILDGKQPIEMTAHTLKRAGELPLLWGEQEMRLGIARTGS